MNMHDDDVPRSIALSPAGAARRRALLAGLQREAHRLRRRRVAVSRSVAGCALAAAGLIAVRMMSPGRSESREVGSTIAHAQLDAPSNASRDVSIAETVAGSETPSPKLVLVTVHTRAGAADRLRADVPSIVQYIGDDDLLRTLAQAGQPAGLVRMNGETLLLPQISGNVLDHQ